MVSTIATLDFFENTGDGVLAVNSDKHIIFWNAAAERLLGFSAIGVLGRKCWRVLAGRDLAGQPVCCHQCSILERCQQGMPVSSFQLITSRHDGREVILNISTLFVPQKRSAEQRDADYVVHIFRLVGDAPAVKEGLLVHLLGPTVAARADGTLVQGPKWRRARVRALLAYFLINKGLWIPKGTLTTRLWPDLPDEAAHRNLSTTVYYLRHSLEPNLGKGSVSRFIGHENNHYIFWDDVPLWMDVESFESSLNDARHEVDQNRAVIHYSTALDSYRGDFQVDVKSDWLWHQSERSRLRTLYLGALMELALLHEQLRQHSVAIELYTRLLTIRPWQEDACQRLMRLLISRNQPEAAFYHYQNLARALGEETTSSPSEESQKLFLLANSRSNLPNG